MAMCANAASPVGAVCACQPAIASSPSSPSSRVNTSVFLKRKNEYVRSTKGCLSITSLWGGMKEVNPGEVAKKNSPVCHQSRIGCVKSAKTLHVTSHSSHGLTKRFNASSRSSYLGVQLQETTTKGLRISTRSSTLQGTARSGSLSSAMAVPDTQQGWMYSEYGGNEVLKLAEIAVPSIAANEVLVKVHAAALNPVDSKRRSGKFKATDSQLPHVPGYDVAGVVVKVGSDVTKFKEGDEVYANVSEQALNGPRQFGSLEQFAPVEEKLLALKPTRLSFAEAASLPLAIETAQEAFDRANLKEGQTVLITRGAGGVGSLAIQLAKHVYGASHVATTASTGKVDFVKSLGADKVIDYKTQKFEELPDKYDVVLDTVGECSRCVQVLKEGGALIVLTGAVEPPGVRFVVTSNGENLAKLTPYLESGKVKAVIDPKGLFKFSELVEAFEYLETGRASGKVVISPIE